MKNNKILFYSVLFIALFLYACRSNQIEFDPDTNTVYSVDNYPIRKLNVVLIQSKKSFWINKVDTLEGSSRIKLDSLGENYIINSDTNNIHNKLFFLKKIDKIPFVPSETYEIYHASIGDASACIIYVLTDEKGKVNRVMKQYEYRRLKETN